MEEPDHVTLVIAIRVCKIIQKIINQKRFFAPERPWIFFSRPPDTKNTLSYYFFEEPYIL